MDVAVATIPDSVSIDLGSLQGQKLGDDGTQYTVELHGRVDGRWIRAFRSLQQNVDAYSRYRLDVDGRSVSFNVRVGDGPDLVIRLIERLVELVQSVESVPAGE
jgi:hypothetical protein